MLPRIALGGAALLATGLALSGCMLGPKTPPPYLACTSQVPAYHYEEYKALCDAGKHVEEHTGDVLVVTGYADRLIGKGEIWRINLDAGEWQARAGRGAELLGGVISQLTAGDVAKGYLKKGLLEVVAFGDKDPRPEQSFTQALDAGGGWDAGATLIALYTRRGLAGKPAIDACQRTYDAGLKEKKDYQSLRALVDTCKGFVIGGKDPVNPYTSIEPEYWDQLRALAAAK